MKTIATRIIIVIWVVLSVFVLFTPEVSANSGFSGSDPSNYTCPALAIGKGTLNTKTFQCEYPNGFTTNAIIRPPTIKVLQYWFMRIIYGAWAASGVVFTIIMVYLGFKYMTSRGDSAKIGDVKKKMKNWAIGLMLIFLSYPVLNTLFSVIGVSKNECFDLQLPAFQFFFPNACNAGGNASATPTQG